MTKPPSITRFEQFYWASFAVGLVNTVLKWSSMQAALAINPMLAQWQWILPLMQLIGIAISVAIWFFIARRASDVAKWVQVVIAGFCALGLLWAVFAIANGSVLLSAVVIVGLLSNGLYIAAAVMLFKPDAKLWFGEDLDEDDDLAMPRG